MADAEPSAAPVAVFKKRKGNANLRKRPATPPPAADSSSDDYSSSEDEAGQRVKRRKKAVGVSASSKPTDSNKDLETQVFKADRSGITSSNDATKARNWYDEGADGAMSEKNLLGSTRKEKDSQPDGTYKGLKNQTKFIERNPDAPQRQVGPQKASSNVRTVTFFDFKPDVCKDYKQTGHCGFGDACIFLHSREDMKQGWQLDKEWENVSKNKKNLEGTIIASANRDVPISKDDDEDEAMLEKIPFACVICKESYREPIVTRCGHYFCEPCALKRYRKDPTCAACGAGTNGVFNSAKRLKKLLERKRERREKKRRERIEAGEEVSDEEEGEKTT